MIPFGPLAPDLAEISEGHVTVAQNVLPVKVGYKPMLGLAAASTAVALPADPRGLISLVLRDGTWRVFGFTAATIQQMDGEYAWTQVANGYACTSGDDWSAVHFGAFLLATNTTDGLLAYNVEAGGSVSAINAANDPRFIFVVANVVVGLDCLDSAGTRDNRLIRNSNSNTHTDWTGGAADYQPLEDGGALVWGGAVSATSALILQAGAARLMQFGNAGGGALYSLQLVSSNVGSVGANSCVVFDNAVYWLSTDGFRRFTLANGVEPIGAGWVDEWFYGVVDQTRINLVQAGIDPFNKMIWWRYPRSGVTSSVIAEDVIGYSWQWKRWVTLDIDTCYLSQIATPGLTTDGGMDDYGVLDAIDIPLDSRIWQGGQPVFGALNSALKFASFTGSTLAATITPAMTVSLQSQLIGKVTPISDAECTIELGVKTDLNDSVTFKTAVAKQASGIVPLRGRGKAFTPRFLVAAGQTWTYAKGVEMGGGR